LNNMLRNTRKNRKNYGKEKNIKVTISNLKKIDKTAGNVHNFSISHDE